MNTIRIGTRGSALALWQANYVAELLRELPEVSSVELIKIETTGDAVQDRPLSAMGGFGVFTREIQNALLDRRVDVAVHSLKDLPTLPVNGLKLAATPPRAPIGDVFISHRHAKFDDLPAGATIGTSSLRRRSQILHRRPDLNLIDLRGNVDTRLRKLRDQNLDGIVLAEAGIRRLGLEAHITEILDIQWMLPAVGQGAIGLECRDDDEFTLKALEKLNDPMTWNAIRAERNMLYCLGGGCLVPIGVQTIVEGEKMTLRAAVLSADGKRKIFNMLTDRADQPLALGATLAANLLNEGARELLLV